MKFVTTDAALRGLRFGMGSEKIPATVVGSATAAKREREKLNYANNRLPMPAHCPHSVPLPSEYTLEFCLWLHRNFDEILEKGLPK
jgi:hypothetical protein